MKINVLKFAIIPFIALFVYSCGEEFLDVEPSDRLSSDQVARAAEFNPDITQGNLSGLYQLMYLPGTGGTTGNDDFGQKGVDIWSDMLSADIAHARTDYGWYEDFSQLRETVDFTNAGANYMGWRYYYRLIRAANAIITTLGGNDAVPELEENKHVMGQAKAMRAYCYFYLIQMYTDRYDPAQEVLPLYIEASVEPLPKSTMSEVYDLIYSDLNDALILLSDFNRTDKVAINTDVVKLLLAYSYASEDKNWDQVKTLTEEVINTGSYTILTKDTALDGMNFISSPGWIWGSDITIDDGISLTSFYAQMDYFTYGYASVDNDKAIDESLYSQMPADDVRKLWFSEDEGLINWYKFYDPARVWDGQRPVVTDVVYMRIAEVYLLHAEAAYKDSDPGSAINALKAVVSERVDDASYIDDLSGPALLDEIILQTRLELWGEGKSYLLKRRNKMDIVRGDNHLIYVGEVMPYDDDRLSLEIPQLEIQNNPFITGQN